MGIRFFDLRIAHKPNDSSDDLYFTHVIYTYLTVLVSIIHRFGVLGQYLLYVLYMSGTCHLQETLSSVATWLESHHKEIVILACSHFEGIDDTLHESFISSLKKLFGSKLCPRKVSFFLLPAADLPPYLDTA